MGFFKKLFGGGLDGDALAASPDKSEYAQIDLLRRFSSPRPRHDAQEIMRWNRVLPRPYDDTLALFVKEGWLTQSGDLFQTTSTTAPFVAAYEARLETGRQRAMQKVRTAIAARDCGEALDIRRQYEISHPLDTADWTGPEPQLSRSSLTRRILFLDHWLLDGLSPETVDWLKLYAAEQHLWEAYWQLPGNEIPAQVAQELASPGLSPSEAAYWKAYQLALLVDNQETWQRCKGGDHVRRIELTGPDDEHTCEHCRSEHGKEYLVVRVPELPHRTCTSPVGCRCRYEPVLESYEDMEA
jgi:hypothetical protein